MQFYFAKSKVFSEIKNQINYRAFSLETTIGEVASTNRFEVMLVDFGEFALVVFGLLEI